MHTGALVKTINIPESHFQFIFRVLHDTVNIPVGEINEVLDELFDRQETALGMAQRANARHASHQPFLSSPPTSSPEPDEAAPHPTAEPHHGIYPPLGYTDLQH